MKTLRAMFIVFLALNLVGCATLFKSKTAKLEIDSDPQGADIFINGNRMGKTPLPLKLSHKESVTITFKKEGYEDKTYIVNTKVGAGWVVLDILGGFIPVIVDAVSENWYSLDSKEVKVLLEANN